MLYAAIVLAYASQAREPNTFHGIIKTQRDAHKGVNVAAGNGDGLKPGESEIKMYIVIKGTAWVSSVAPSTKESTIKDMITEIKTTISDYNDYCSIIGRPSSYERAHKTYAEQAVKHDATITPAEGFTNIDFDFVAIIRPDKRQPLGFCVKQCRFSNPDLALNLINSKKRKDTKQ